MTDELLTALSDAALASAVDTPLQEAASGFEVRWRPPFDRARLHTLMTRYYLHLAGREGSDLPQLDARCALTEVVELLERGFRGTWADGYDGALLEVIQDPEHGADRVLAALLQLVQQRARERRIHLLTHRMIDALDWRQRAAVAAELRRRLAGDGGSQFNRLPAALLGPYVLELAQALLETNRNIEHLLHDPRQLLP